ncbi:MAG: hypothetical protein IKX88_14720 [Thermoguttaceae bacterium]|nr:hypothetical protein [Thermoguttaceae bacterium]
MRNILFIQKVMAFVVIFAVASCYAADDQVRLYSYRMDPAERPEVERYAVRPPSWDVFDGKTQFITLRSFPSENDIGQRFDETLDQYQNAELGRIIWPHAGTIFYKNLGELAETIKRRDLYLFDFWGYVPGSGPRESGDWTQFKADPAQFNLLEDILGERWLGMDNGEQDGRFVGGYSPTLQTSPNDKIAPYFAFQRHFERLGDDLGNRLATLVSLNFGHYFLKEGTYTLIGAETAQALPNGQIYYSWIRGAGKQYGVLWFGNASVYNRWGWKAYPNKPTEGASLALLKRLMYSHLLYNSAGVGYETGWFVNGELGPIGKIQQTAKRWLDENGDPGVQATPIAFLCDFQCGWSFPRHLYTGKTYQVWGNLPYSSGDYLTNDLFDLAYPGYQDSSYFHNEKGFMTPTPYGDCVDALLTDAPLVLLKQYSTIFIADELNPSVELLDKLTAYVANGGRLVFTADVIKKFGSFLGVSLAHETPKSFENASILWNDGSKILETAPFDAYILNLPTDSKTIAACDEIPMVAEIAYGEGSAVVLASPFGLSSKRAFEGPVANSQDSPLANPYPLLNFARKTFEAEMNRNVLFDVGEDLSSIVCRKSENVYTIGVFNNELKELPFEISSRIGSIVKLRELKIDESERDAVGFAPTGFEDVDFGKNTESTIAGLSVRVFEATVDSETITPIEKTKWPELPKGRFLAFRSPLDIQKPLKESILTRPTFFQHWDGVLVDWKYFNARSIEQLREEAGWLRRQSLKIAVDFSSGIDLFPDLRLIKNDPAEYERSMNAFRSVIEKAAILEVKDVIVRAHRNPENNYSSEQTYLDTIEAFKEICDVAANKGMRVSLRICLQSQLGWSVPGSTVEAALKALEDVDRDNFYLAPTLYAAKPAIESAELWERAKTKISAFLVAGWLTDENNGSVWTDSAPLSSLSDKDITLAKEAIPADANVIFDGVYNNADEEYLDVKRWESQ